MDYYGNSGDYVYLGWMGRSPQFDKYIDDQATNYIYWFHFAYWFFQRTLDPYNSVKDTLQSLSWDIYNCYFEASPLYGYLVAWGNWNMHLGY